MPIRVLTAVAKLRPCFLGVRPDRPLVETIASGNEANSLHSISLTQ